MDAGIEYGDLRDQVCPAMATKNVECDYVRGKLFVASEINSCKVTIVDKSKLKEALRKGGNSVVHMTIGARHSDFNPDTELGKTQDSDGNLIGYIDPPDFVEPKNSKQAAKVNVDAALRVKNFVDALYYNETSPFYHGFTLYHYGLIKQHIKTKLDASDDSLLTDVENHIYPEVGDWHTCMGAWV